LWLFFVREHFLRFTTQMHGKTEPFYYFLPVLIGGTLPWSVFLIRAWQPAKWKEAQFRKEENRFLVVWFLFVFLFYSVSSSKLATYIAPVFLPMALFAGNIFRNHEEAPEQSTGQRGVFYRLLLWIQFLIIVAAVLLIPVLKQYHDPSLGLVIMISDAWWIYILPVFLAAGLMTFLPDWIARKKQTGWFFSAYLLCCLFLVGLLFPLNDFLSPYRSALVAKEAIARHVPRGKLLYQYRVNFYGIDFYNKIRTPIVEDFGELGDGIAKLPEAERKEYFLSAQDFFEKGRQEKEIYCITQHEERLKELRAQFARVDILWENGAFYLLRIRNQEQD
jgi:hypothetical protein